MRLPRKCGCWIFLLPSTSCRFVCDREGRLRKAPKQHPLGLAPFFPCRTARGGAGADGQQCPLPPRSGSSVADAVSPGPGARFPRARRDSGRSRALLSGRARALPVLRGALPRGRARGPPPPVRGEQRLPRGAEPAPPSTHWLPVMSSPRLRAGPRAPIGQRCRQSARAPPPSGRTFTR